MIGYGNNNGVIDGTDDDGQCRLLREFLRDSPELCTDFAVLACTDAALQLAGLSGSRRRERASGMIWPSAGEKVRRMLRRPAFRCHHYRSDDAGHDWA